MIPKGWRTYKLGEIAEIIGGGTPSTTIEEYWKGTIPWLTPRDLTNYNFKYISKGERSITEKGLNNSSARMLPQGAVLLTSRAPIGYLVIAKNPVCTNQGFKSLITDDTKVDNQFLYYLLKNNIDQIKSFGTGTTFAEVSGNTLKGIEFEFPEYKAEQSRIASILSSLDDKIELNLQMNKTLEAIAQAIFKEWFMDFRFPGFDGELVDGLPRGWKKSTIGSIAKNIQYGYTESSSREEIGPKFLRITDIQNGNVDWSQVPYCSIQDKEFEKYKIKEHDIFIARTGASTGENIYIIESPSAVFASYLIRVQFEKPEYAFFIGKFLRHEVYFNYIASSLGGSAQPNANAKTLTNIVIVVPENTILKKYFDLVSPLHNKIVLNQKEILILTQLRDSLLPKLMTGKIKV